MRMADATSASLSPASVSRSALSTAGTPTLET